MIIERLLPWSWHRNGARAILSSNTGTVDTQGPLSKREGRNAIVAVQWLAAIGTSYLVIAVHNLDIKDPLPALVILLCLLSAVLLQRVPETLFEKRIIEPGLAVLNAILILSAITTSEQIPWDLLILFFFCVFIAAIGENLVQIAVGCVLLSFVFLVFVSPNVVAISTMDANFLFRVPFMFAISIFYGHLANQVKQEKKRAERMQEAANLKRQLICALAHDIKTPLNVILGHAELLVEPSPPADKRDSFACIRKNVDRISKLITDFLDVSKLESVTFQGTKDWVHMNAIAEDVVAQQRITAREKNLRLILELENNLEPILGDEDQMQRALWNLVSNAIKFTPNGGTVSVLSQTRERHVVIQVKDTGTGIPQEELSSLFSEFRRLEGAVNTEGTGLGLFIVKTIVEVHGGTVSVQSTVGVGTTFTILLPRQTRKPEAALRRAA